MKYVLRIVIVSILFGSFSAKAQDVDQNPQWIFFKNIIPKHKSITISGNNWNMTINDKYKVTFSGKYNDSSSDYSEMSNYSMSESATFRGTGIVIWDTDRMKIKLTTQANGNYRYTGDWYKWVRTKIKGSTVANIGLGILTGNYDSVDEYRTEKQLDYSRNDYASGSKTISSTFDVIANIVEGKLGIINGAALNLSMSGNTSREVSLKVASGWYTPKYIVKSENELSSSNDEFGEWNWNQERSKIYLKSSSGDNTFVIWNIDGRLSWSLEIEKNAKGQSETITEKGDSITHISMSFDGEPNLNLQFAKYRSNPKKKIINENKVDSIKKTIQIPIIDNNTNEIVSLRDSIYYVDSLYTITREELIYNKRDKIIISNKDESKDLLDYVTYNRFTGTLSKDSSTTLDGIKNKQMLMFSYSVQGEDKFDMFSLEGLESIINYLSITEE